MNNNFISLNYNNYSVNFHGTKILSGRIFLMSFTCI
nr:MAG TPA: hypothetical protein [Caudoviricetes sp.]